VEFLGGGNVDYRNHANMPQKLLNFGFALTVFVSVTAYTANLVAFLTNSNAKNYLAGIDDAIANEVPICAFGALRQDLVGLHPDADWQFVTTMREIFTAYDEGECEVIVEGYLGARSSTERQEEFWCARELRSESGHPSSKSPSDSRRGRKSWAAFSCWIAEAANQGATFHSYLELQEKKCNFPPPRFPDERRPTRRRKPDEEATRRRESSVQALSNGSSRVRGCHRKTN